MTANDPAVPTASGLPKLNVASLATLVLDGLTVGGFILFQPLLTQGFASQHGVWGAVIITGYLVLCICTWMLMRLKPLEPAPVMTEDEKDSNSGCLAFFSLCFGMMVVVMLIELTGAMEDGGFVDNLSGNDLAETAMALGIFVLPLIYLFVVMLKPKPVVTAGTARHYIQRMVATVGINMMFIITLAYWDSSLGNSEPMGFSLGGHILMFLLMYAVMLMFLAPPRLILHSIEGSKVGLASFCFWLAVYTWNLTI